MRYLAMAVVTAGADRLVADLAWNPFGASLFTLQHAGWA
jgi:hypothetical protein